MLLMITTVLADRIVLGQTVSQDLKMFLTGVSMGAHGSHHTTQVNYNHISCDSTSSVIALAS